jgi:hypothetical protein
MKIQKPHIDNLINGYSEIVGSSSITPLDSNSPKTQRIIGVQTQTILMPLVTTLQINQDVDIINYKAYLK